MSPLFKNRKSVLVLSGLIGLMGLAASMIISCQDNKINCDDGSDSLRIFQLQDRDHHLTHDSLYRGTIFDRTGAILAVSQKVSSALARPSMMPSTDDWVPQASKILDLDFQTVTDLLAETQGPIWLKGGLSVEQGLRLRGMQLKGLDVLERHMRSYPCGSLASPVLGFVDCGGRGLEGIEYTYDNLLSRTGLTFTNGQDLILTIERGVQVLSENILEGQIRKLQADNGCLVIMNIQNGEVLALASKPSWDPKRFWELPTTCITNYALHDQVDPAVLIPLINRIAVQRGLLQQPGDQTDRFMTSEWKWETIGGGMALWSPWNEADPNIFALYDNMSRDLWDLGFGQPTGIDLPNEGKGGLPLTLPRSWDYLLNQGVTANPIQILSAFSTLINGGRSVKPHLALQVPDGFTIPEFPGLGQGRSRVPWLTKDLTLKLLEELTVQSGPSLASIRWDSRFEHPSAESPAQVTALGFWPDKLPIVSYVLLIDGAAIDPRKRRGTLGWTLGVVKQAAKIPMENQPLKPGSEGAIDGDGSKVQGSEVQRFKG